MEIRTRDLVAVNWELIEKLAKELLRVPTLPGDALRDFLTYQRLGFTPELVEALSNMAHQGAAKILQPLKSKGDSW